MHTFDSFEEFQEWKMQEEQEIIKHYMYSDQQHMNKQKLLVVTCMVFSEQLIHCLCQQNNVTLNVYNNVPANFVG